MDISLNLISNGFLALTFSQGNLSPQPANVNRHYSEPLKVDVGNSQYSISVKYKTILIKKSRTYMLIKAIILI